RLLPVRAVGGQIDLIVECAVDPHERRAVLRTARGDPSSAGSHETQGHAGLRARADRKPPRAGPIGPRERPVSVLPDAEGLLLQPRWSLDAEPRDAAVE